MSLAKIVDDLCTQARWSMMHDEAEEAGGYVRQCETIVKMYPDDEATKKVVAKLDLFKEWLVKMNRLFASHGHSFKSPYVTGRTADLISDTVRAIESRSYLSKSQPKLSTAVHDHRQPQTIRDALILDDLTRVQSLQESIGDLCYQARWSINHDEPQKAMEYARLCEERVTFFPREHFTPALKLKIKSLRTFLRKRLWLVGNSDAAAKRVVGAKYKTLLDLSLESARLRRTPQICRADMQEFSAAGLAAKKFRDSMKPCRKSVYDFFRF